MKTACEFSMCGQKWKCIRIPGNGDLTFGGQCDLITRVIAINETYQDAEFLGFLHHELFEGAAFYLGCVYTRLSPDRADLFSMSHLEMDNLSNAINGAYEEIREKMIPPKRRSTKIK